MNLGTFSRARILFASLTFISFVATGSHAAKLEVVGKDDLAIDGCRIRLSSDQAPHSCFRLTDLNE